MPIGLGTALTAGAAVLGAGATIYASSKASHAQTQAAQTASNDQLQVAQENNDLARQMYDANAARLDPYSALGLPAGAEYNGLLGIAIPAGVSSTAAPAPLPKLTGAGGGSSSGSSTSALGSVPPQVQQIETNLYNDGIPGNGASALAAYYAANPVTVAQAEAMKNDGIKGNYAAAIQSATPNASALAPVVAQQAQQAIAAGADPNAVAQRAASYGVAI